MICFSFDSLDIVGCQDGHALIKGHIEMETVLVAMDHDLLGYALQLWLDRKEDYCDRWKEFCGVGYIGSEKYTEVGETNLLVGFNDETEEPIYKNDTKVYLIEDPDSLVVDMEHG